jgi:hypothetical protein
MANLLRQALLVVAVLVALEVAQMLVLVARVELAEVVVLEVATVRLVHQEILVQQETLAATATIPMVQAVLAAAVGLVVQQQENTSVV